MKNGRECGNRCKTKSHPHGATSETPCLEHTVSGSDTIKERQEVNSEHRTQRNTTRKTRASEEMETRRKIE